MRVVHVTYGYASGVGVKDMREFGLSDSGT